MRMCQDHWNRLRAKIEEAGLAGLVADNGEQAAKNMADEMQNGPRIDNFDPLMGAHNAIVGNALHVGGLAIIAPNADGTERCPICYLNEWGRIAWETYKDHAGKPCPCPDDCGGIVPLEAPTYDGWLDRAATDMKAEWEALNAST